MAEILIKAFDDPGLRGWMRGDPIDIRPDNFAWGLAEGDPTLSYVVQITDASPEQLAGYLEPLLDPVETDPLSGDPRVLRPRRWYAHGTPLQWQAELASTGRIVKTWAEVRGYIIDKETGLSEAGTDLE